MSKWKASLLEQVKDRVRNQIKKEGPRQASVDFDAGWTSSTAQVPYD